VPIYNRTYLPHDPTTTTRTHKQITGKKRAGEELRGRPCTGERRHHLSSSKELKRAMQELMGEGKKGGDGVAREPPPDQNTNAA
jgi:hypothetical protein